MFKRINATVLSYVLLISLGLGTTLFLQQKNIQEVNLETDPNYDRQETLIQANLEFLKQLPSFGFRNLIANWTFLQFIQYYGDYDARQETGSTLIPDFLEAVIDRDPRFVRAHLMLSTATTVYAGQPETTVEYLEKALPHLSPEIHEEAHFVWSYKGTDEMLFLDRLDAAKNSYRMAAQWVSESNHPAKEAMANRYLSTANFLAENPDSVRARIGAWVNVLTNVRDEETRNRIIEEIEALGGTVNIYPNGRIRVQVPEED